MSYYDQRGLAKRTYVDTHAWYSRPLAGLGGLGTTLDPPPGGVPADFYVPPGVQYLPFDEKGIPRAELGQVMPLFELSFLPEVVSARTLTHHMAVAPTEGTVTGDRVFGDWADAGLLVTYHRAPPAELGAPLRVSGMTPAEFFARRGDKNLFWVGIPGAVMPTRAFWAPFEKEIAKGVPAVQTAGKGMVIALSCVGAALGLAFAFGGKH